MTPKKGPKSVKNAIFGCFLKSGRDLQDPKVMGRVKLPPKIPVFYAILSTFERKKTHFCPFLDIGAGFTRGVGGQKSAKIDLLTVGGPKKDPFLGCF